MKTRVLLYLLIAMAGVSCVPIKQLRNSEQQVVQLETRNKELQAHNHDLTVQNRELTSRIEVLERRIMQADEELNEVKRALHIADESYKSVMEQNKNLLRIQNELASGSDAETRKILVELQKAQNDLQTREDRLRKLEDEFAIKKSNFDQLQADFVIQQERLVELETILNQKDSLMTALQNGVTRALFNFTPDELRVEMRNGLLYVSLEEKLLFHSGSFEVGPKGVDAVQKLAEVLQSNPDIQIHVEGHTDNVPYRTTSSLLIDNWDLSVKRATSIIRILLNSSSIDPIRLTASGRGEYLPLATNEDTDGRQKNRRTEIILSPKLDDLFELIGK